MINKIDFTAKNLTSNAGLFLLLENAKSNEIFDLVEDDLVFDNDSTNKIKMNHIKTMICGHFIGIDKLERLKLLQNDPLVNEFDISVKEPETVSRFLGNFTFKTTQMFRDINFKVFKKLLTKSKLTSITIDIDSSVINVEGHQEGASKGYNPKKLGNRCYNIQFAFCDELKAYVTGFVRSGNTYTANGASEMIKEIVANIKTDDLEILFRMDSGYFDEKIIETIESLGCKYLIKAKSYSTLASQATNSSVVFVKMERNGKVYLGTTNQKKVYQQLLANSKVEVSGMAKGKWIRLTGEAVIDDTVEAREAMLEANPPLRDMYSADDGKFTVFYLKNMQAVLYSFTGDPEILDN
ncbi:IS1380 family transposase [Staphylococcus aureus]|nr:IS1380 family transposase [Staphylococcus aureus]MDN8959637.1 IS1380 family transposase [Staphylococcus aureus]